MFCREMKPFGWPVVLRRVIHTCEPPHTNGHEGRRKKNCEKLSSSCFEQMVVAKSKHHLPCVLICVKYRGEC